MKFIPRIGNIGFNNESSLDIPRLATRQQESILSKIDPVQYERFARNKFVKPAIDIYAMYSPYSESYRAFYPFIDFLKRTLAKGDIIVDLSNRTGWSAFLLAGIFPEQKIISCWEDNTDVLGYNGFNFWFNEMGNVPNLEICFTKLRERLPFETESVRVVFGFDILHHHVRSPLIDEILRIVVSNGFVFFPHVHLANAEPEPFFKRGGDLVHGIEYTQALDRNVKGFKTFVYSEAELFLFQKEIIKEIHSKPSTPHYNGLVVLASPENSFHKELCSVNFIDLYGIENCNAIFNYLFETSSLGKVSINKKPVLQEHLARHPVYFDVLIIANGYQLNDTERKILYWIEKGYTLSRIQSILAMETDAYKVLLRTMERLDIVQLLPVSQNAVRLQIYHATQKWVEADGDRTLPALWHTTLKLYSENVYLTDDQTGTSYSYKEIDQIIGHIITSFKTENLRPGSLIMLEDGYSVVSFSIFWAAMRLGAACVPFSASISATDLNDLIQKYRPEIVFSGKKLAPVDGILNVLLDDTYESENSNHFSSWLAGEPTELASNVQESDVAVILNTSGSNGSPKGVKLTHAQLFQSAANIAETYNWTEKDRFLALGSLESMSGLRNACIVPVKCGGSTVIANGQDLHLASRIAGQIEQHGVTIFSGSPVLYHQLAQVKNLKQQLKSLRLALSTGSKLSEKLRTLFFNATGLKIRNYYGLTETSGICVAQRSTDGSEEEDCVGLPVDALLKVKPTGELNANTGELYIYSGNLSKGYFEEGNVMDLDADGWLRTRDLVFMDERGAVHLKGRSEHFIKTQRNEVIYFASLEAVIAPILNDDYALIPFVKNEAEYVGLVFTAGSEEAGQIEKLVWDKINIEFGLWKVPLEFFKVDFIPRKQNGKVDRQKLLEII